MTSYRPIRIERNCGEEGEKLRQLGNIFFYFQRNAYREMIFFFPIVGVFVW